MTKKIVKMIAAVLFATLTELTMRKITGESFWTPTACMAIIYYLWWTKKDK